MFKVRRDIPSTYSYHFPLIVSFLYSVFLNVSTFLLSPFRAPAEVLATKIPHFDAIVLCSLRGHSGSCRGHVSHSVNPIDFNVLLRALFDEFLFVVCLTMLS
jgi:hypothetical protein